MTEQINTYWIVCRFTDDIPTYQSTQILYGKTEKEALNEFMINISKLFGVSKINFDSITIFQDGFKDVKIVKTENSCQLFIKENKINEILYKDLCIVDGYLNSEQVK